MVFSYFKDRVDAAEQLSKKLKHYKNHKNTLILGLARGGVITAYEISKELNIPLKVILPRKIGAPHNPEFAIGAIVEKKVMLNDEVIDELNISNEYIQKVIEKEKGVIEKRKYLYQLPSNYLNIKGMEIILIDDGIATGLTIMACIQFLKTMKVNKIIVAVPVSSQEAYNTIKKEVDEIICIEAPPFFSAISQFYEKFEQVNDETIIKILKESSGNN